jgi:hypothetical protein
MTVGLRCRDVSFRVAGVEVRVDLIDLLDGWAIVLARGTSGTTSTTRTGEAARSTSAREPTWSTALAASTVELHHDGVGNTGNREVLAHAWSQAKTAGGYWETYASSSFC